MEPDLCLCLQVSSMSPTEQTWIRRKQTDAEIEPCDADLLSDDVGGPDVRLEEGALAETDDCELVFESVNHMVPALEANGRFIQTTLDWDFKDQTSDIIAKNTSTNTTTK